MVVPIFRREEYLISFYINIIFYQKIIKNFADWTFKLFFKPNKLIECIVSFVPKLSNSITLLIIYIILEMKIPYSKQVIIRKISF